MKLLLPLLVLSVAANGVLVLGPWRERMGPSAADNPAARPLSAEAEILAAVDPDLTAAIASGDTTQLLTALRQAGFPDRYVRAMTWAAATGDSDELLEVYRRQAATPFWRLGVEQVDDQRRMREAARRSRERMLAAFGGRMPADLSTVGRVDSRYRFLPADKIAAVAQIDSDYAAMAIESQAERGTLDQSVMRLLDQERRADLAKVLTAEEMELHDLYLSSSAASLRRQLAGFQPTEAEFRAMFSIRRSIDEASGRPVGMPGMNFISTDSRDNAKYRAVLSPERSAEFDRSQDQGYRAAQEIVNHYNLPPAAALESYELQKAYQARMRDGSAMATPETRRELAQQARADFTRVLSPAGAEAYFATAGRWIIPLETAADLRGRAPSG